MKNILFVSLLTVALAAPAFAATGDYDSSGNSSYNNGDATMNNDNDTGVTSDNPYMNDDNGTMTHSKRYHRGNANYNGQENMNDNGGANNSSEDMNGNGISYDQNGNQ